MRINFEMLDLRIFLSIYDFGSFRRAAELLNISQPALSRRLVALEHVLRVPLFERTTRRVVPTAAGIRLEPHARRIVADVDNSLVQAVGWGEQELGHIVIASIPSAALYFLPMAIKQFNRRYPDIRVRIIDRTPHEALDCVLNGEVEFGINMVVAEEKDVCFTHLTHDPYVFICNAQHPLSGRSSASWLEISAYPLVSIGRANSENRALLDRSLLRSNLHLNWFYEVSNAATALGLVSAGVAATILPRLATPMGNQTADFGLSRVSVNSPTISRDVGIVERRNSFLSAGATSFRDMLLVNWKSFDGQPAA
jgi:DNA-binding transcriptional LysR family regulator